MLIVGLELAFCRHWGYLIHEELFVQDVSWIGGCVGGAYRLFCVTLQVARPAPYAWNRDDRDLRY